MGHQVTENILKIAFSYFNILFFRNVVKLLKDVLRRQPVEDDMDSSETLDEENYEVEKNMSSTILEVRGWLDNNISSNCSIRHGRGRRMRRFSFIKISPDRHFGRRSSREMSWLRRFSVWSSIPVWPTSSWPLWTEMTGSLTGLALWTWRWFSRWDKLFIRQSLIWR